MTFNGSGSGEALPLPPLRPLRVRDTRPLVYTMAVPNSPIVDGHLPPAVRAARERLRRALQRLHSVDAEAAGTAASRSATKAATSAPQAEAALTPAAPSPLPPVPTPAREIAGVRPVPQLDLQHAHILVVQQAGHGHRGDRVVVDGVASARPALRRVRALELRPEPPVSARAPGPAVPSRYRRSLNQLRVAPATTVRRGPRAATEDAAVATAETMATRVPIAVAETSVATETATETAAVAARCRTLVPASVPPDQRTVPSSCEQHNRKSAGRPHGAHKRSASATVPGGHDWLTSIGGSQFAVPAPPREAEAAADHMYTLLPAAQQNSRLAGRLVHRLGRLRRLGALLQQDA